MIPILLESAAWVVSITILAIAAVKVWFWWFFDRGEEKRMKYIKILWILIVLAGWFLNIYGLFEDHCLNLALNVSCIWIVVLCHTKALEYASESLNIIADLVEEFWGRVIK